MEDHEAELRLCLENRQVTDRMKAHFDEDAISFSLIGLVVALIGALLHWAQ